MKVCVEDVIPSFLASQYAGEAIDLIWEPRIERLNGNFVFVLSIDGERDIQDFSCWRG